MKKISYTLLCLWLSGCSQNHKNPVADPPLSPVGSGLIPQAQDNVAAIYPTGENRAEGWVGGSADLFRDRRAHKPGDILTVVISVNDRAALNSSSNESRKSNIEGGIGFDYKIMGMVKTEHSGKGKLNTNTSANGQGQTTRSEKIDLSIAAVVVDILPNGYVVIKGTQEIKVNIETRVLIVSGIVHPRDISENGFVPYDKVAEARISYGGHGAISDVQKPGWGQRLVNKLAPF